MADTPTRTVWVEPCPCARVVDGVQAHAYRREVVPAGFYDDLRAAAQAVVDDPFDAVLMSQLNDVPRTVAMKIEATFHGGPQDGRTETRDDRPLFIFFPVSRVASFFHPSTMSFTDEILRTGQIAYKLRGPAVDGFADYDYQPGWPRSGP